LPESRVTAGLDPREVVRLRDFLAAHRGRQTLVISSHMLPELEASCLESELLASTH